MKNNDPIFWPPSSVSNDLTQQRNKNYADSINILQTQWYQADLDQRFVLASLQHGIYLLLVAVKALREDLLHRHQIPGILHCLLELNKLPHEYSNTNIRQFQSGSETLSATLLAYNKTYRPYTTHQEALRSHHVAQNRDLQLHVCQKTVFEMDETLIANWNSCVKPDDLVYHLGDFAISSAALNSVCSRLNGHKILIKGNHDKGWEKFYKAGFGYVTNEAVVKIGHYTCLLVHDPGTTTGSVIMNVLLHGHHHNPSTKVNNGQINLNCELWEYRPVSERALLKCIKGL